MAPWPSSKCSQIFVAKRNWINNISLYVSILRILTITFLGRVHTMPEKFKHAALYLRLALPSTIIRHENKAFWKRTSNRKNLKTQLHFYG